ncbi:MAG: demethylmenaquinone methyltransferase [Promethearchaeota archaeon CR_4]|nr:MAG: demethylmenaquinone methyltransferase [Candidatus Lokiarchaeota archaeon CR_4]
MSDSEIHTYETYYQFRKPLIRLMINFLYLPKNTVGLDAACGIGHITRLLADAVAPNGKVRGLDINENFIHYAFQCNRTEMQAKMDFKQGTILKLPFESNSFDWLWSMDSPHSILNVPDYYAFFTYTAFIGTVAK